MKFREAVKIGAGLYLGASLVSAVILYLNEALTKKESEKSETTTEEETE